jgi:DNA polymerase
MLRNYLEMLGDSLAELKHEGISTVPVDAASLALLRKKVQETAGASAVTRTAPAFAPAVSAAAFAPARASRPVAAAVFTPPSAPAPAPARTPVPVPAPTPPALAPASAPPAPPASPAPAGLATLPPPPLLSPLPAGDKVSRLAWLRDLVLADPVCNAHKHRGKRLVFGVGNPDADIFFCGEAPGAEEETKGEPFVGPAGQLLDKIITATGLSRERVYIANIMKWRPEMPTSSGNRLPTTEFSTNHSRHPFPQSIPTGNRPPTTEEMAFCLPFLLAQLDIIRPKVIVALGNTAIVGLLGDAPENKVGNIHGKWHDFRGTPLMPTYHPSYLLRNNSLRSKRIVWEDLLLVMAHISLPISEKQRNFFLSPSVA